VIKALDLMPQARALADNAKKVVAQRNSALQLRVNHALLTSLVISIF